MPLLIWLLGCDVQAVQAHLNPLQSLERVPRVPFVATIEERLDAGGYSYLRLDDGRWVVGLDKGHAPGDAVRIVPFGVARDFESHRTGQTFDTLTFGMLGDP
jgi:hypothetical protein